MEGRTLKKEGFKTRMENNMRNVESESRMRRAGR